jgi:hypothetical protein
MMTRAKTDPLLPLLNLLHHRDRFVRAAMLEQVLADGVKLTAPERLAIFDSPDWQTAYPIWIFLSRRSTALAPSTTPSPSLSQHRVSGTSARTRTCSASDPTAHRSRPRCWWRDRLS